MIELQNIIFEVTQACNHACVHCYNYWSENRAPVLAKGTLSRKEIHDIICKIQADFSIRRIALSGGEPLLRKDITSITHDLVNLGLNVIIITNGTLLTKEKLLQLPERLTFEITLFSSDSKIHDSIARQPGAFKKLIDNAIAIHNHNCALAISCVLSRQNIQDLDKTIELALAIGADGIAINRVNLSRNTIPLGFQLVPKANELKDAFDLVEKIASKYGIAIAISVPVPPCVLEPGNYKYIHFGWCPHGETGSYYTIGYNGLVRPCNHSSIILGDLRKESFKKIIKSKKANKLWDSLPGECKNCEHSLRDVCRGGCPAAGYECTGAYGQIDPFVGFSLRE